MLQYALYALLAPAVASAMAFPWAGPEPTLVIPEEDNWSPAPTKAPYAGALELFKRAAGDNTCGYLSGSSASSLTCNNPSYVCATNSVYGVHGCCDPSSLSSCSIKTTCIPSSLMSVSCTDAACSSNDYIAKCTADQPFCYQWRYVYSTKTVLTEYGCATSAYTISVQRTFDGENSAAASSSQAVIPISYVTVTAQPSGSSGSSVASSSTSSGQNNAQPASGSAASGTSTATPAPEPKKSHTGAIVGGVVGGLAGLAAIAAALIFCCLRSRKNKKNAAATQQPGATGATGGAPGVAEYKPQPQGYPPQGPEGYPQQQQAYAPQQGGYYQQDVKNGYAQQGVPGQEMGGLHPQQAPYSPPMSPTPQYGAFMTAPPAGVAEAGGSEIQHANAAPGQHPHGANGQPVYEAPA